MPVNMELNTGLPRIVFLLPLAVHMMQVLFVGLLSAIRKAALRGKSDHEGL